MVQKSLVLLKPDAVRRGITGEVLDRFEQTGLKIIGAKLLNAADPEVSHKHYYKDEEWHKKVGELNLKDCADLELDPMDIFGTKDAVEIGRIVNEWLFAYVEKGPIFAFVFEGPHAVEKIRSLVGPTYPVTAPPGTIRGDYGLDSTVTSLQRKRAVYNLIHASGTPEEAEYEIGLWFKPEELISYRRPEEDVYQY